MKKRLIFLFVLSFLGKNVDAQKDTCRRFFVNATSFRKSQTITIGTETKPFRKLPFTFALGFEYAKTDFGLVRNVLTSTSGGGGTFLSPPLKRIFSETYMDFQSIQVPLTIKWHLNRFFYLECGVVPSFQIAGTVKNYALTKVYDKWDPTIESNILVEDRSIDFLED